MKDRVFVCLGELNYENENRKHAWVMTFDRKYETVTFWEPLKPIKFTLEGRINQGEYKWLRFYLSPQLTASEKKTLKKKLNKQEQTKAKLKAKEEKRMEEIQAQAEKPKMTKNQVNIAKKFLSTVINYRNEELGGNKNNLNF